jgi:hypothetical protein
MRDSAYGLPRILLLQRIALILTHTRLEGSTVGQSPVGFLVKRLPVALHLACPR